jgi:hypothetical protein
MQETPQQYTQRILGHSSGKDPIKLQQAAPRKFSALTKGLSKKQLTRRPEPGKWSIAEILAHMADAELVIGYRLRLNSCLQRHAHSSLRSGRLGRDFQLRQLQCEDFAGNLSHAA